MGKQKYTEEVEALCQALGLTSNDVVSLKVDRLTIVAETAEMTEDHGKGVVRTVILTFPRH